MSAATSKPWPGNCFRCTFLFTLALGWKDANSPFVLSPSSYNSRKDLTCELQRLCCRTLIVVGDHSPFRDESEHMMAHMNPETTSLFEVEACGSLVTEERPHMLEMPLERFLLTLGYDLSATETISISCSPVHSPTSILYSMEEFSPKGCGLKLKPIRTRLEL